MRITIKAKLAATFAVVIALSGVSMVVAMQNLGSLNSAFAGAMDGNVKRIQMANDLEVATLEVARDEKSMILSSDLAEVKTIAGELDHAAIDRVLVTVNDRSVCRGGLGFEHLLA